MIIDPLNAALFENLLFLRPINETFMLLLFHAGGLHHGPEGDAKLYHLLI